MCLPYNLASPPFFILYTPLPSNPLNLTWPPLHVPTLSSTQPPRLSTVAQQEGK